MNNHLPRYTRLRAILAGDQCVTASSLFDPMSARIADDLGFEVGVMGGSVASLAVLGAPDLIVLSLSELVEQARRVCRAGQLSVVVDADHGYGNALNVMRTVEELQAAAVAAISIEDTLLPRAFGAAGGAQLNSIEEGVGKMRAAVKARGAGPMAIFGRTSAVAISGVDDTSAASRPTRKPASMRCSCRASRLATSSTGLPARSACRSFLAAAARPWPTCPAWCPPSQMRTLRLAR